jgi:predicted kinase
MVRAKIGLMRAAQVGSAGEIGTLRQGFRRYLALAAGCARRQRGFIAITHGFSGSGKTTLSQPLVELTGAIRIRSDIERKRMHGVAATGHGESGIAGGLYSADVTDATYRRLLDLARRILASGHGVIVDATFLKRQHRDLFRAFAAQAGVAFAIVDFTAPEAVLRGRIAARARLGADASDADQAVLQHQIRSAEALQSDELAAVFRYDASLEAQEARTPGTWAVLLHRLMPDNA